MYKAGEFCWVDLLTTDAAAAKDFYGEVFGWTAADTAQPGHAYSMFSKDGKLVGGLGEMSAEMKAAGVPVVWNSYVATDDVTVTAAKATDTTESTESASKRASKARRAAQLKKRRDRKSSNRKDKASKKSDKSGKPAGKEPSKPPPKRPVDDLLLP